MHSTATTHPPLPKPLGTDDATCLPTCCILQHWCCLAIHTRIECGPLLLPRYTGLITTNTHCQPSTSALADGCSFIFTYVLIHTLILPRVLLSGNDTMSTLPRVHHLWATMDWRGPLKGISRNSKRVILDRGASRCLLLVTLTRGVLLPPTSLQ